jgi:hypothetical protein
MMDFRAWREVFMDDEEGDAVYAMLLGMRWKEGAVPKGMEIRHGNTREELNGLGGRKRREGLRGRVLMRLESWRDVGGKQKSSVLRRRDL